MGGEVAVLCVRKGPGSETGFMKGGALGRAGLLP